MQGTHRADLWPLGRLKCPGVKRFTAISTARYHWYIVTGRRMQGQCSPRLTITIGPTSSFSAIPHQSSLYRSHERPAQQPSPAKESVNCWATWVQAEVKVGENQRNVQWLERVSFRALRTFLGHLQGASSESQTPPPSQPHLLDLIQVLVAVASAFSSSSTHLLFILSLFTTNLSRRIAERRVRARHD